MVLAFGEVTIVVDGTNDAEVGVAVSLLRLSATGWFEEDAEVVGTGTLATGVVGGEGTGVEAGVLLSVEVVV